MSFIEDQLVTFKDMFEEAIRASKSDGLKAKTSIIRSSKPINLIHEAVKHELTLQGVKASHLHPPKGKSSPELKIAGFLKQKKQDVCVTPNCDRVPKVAGTIDWGPLKYKKLEDPLGTSYTEKTLVINVRSQLSSVAKNRDTLFERTFAEALNLHMRYPQMVLGEVYLIPLYEYDEKAMKHKRADKRIRFKKKPIKIQEYLSFFHGINNRANDTDDLYKYERCALLIVDFRPDHPVLYTTERLVAEELLDEKFAKDLSALSFNNFAKDILTVYENRFDIRNLTT
nr:hypothetical protein [uncultured Agathobaculum sp.]